ncbi:beta-ketoacyl synthase N-terminal-like domain-containing protein [Clostridiaceae bacterium M8S5]|nr:beta-ketoacyl synthase N-terminal-like domain-containing protein [Clostridiaceae bacterium M8S5]
MTNKENINRYILEQVKKGNMDKKISLLILKEINKKTSLNDDIAIIGMSCKYPLADNIPEYWRLLKNEVHAIREFPKRRKKIMGIDKNITIGGYIDKIDMFDAQFFNISPKEAESMHPTQRMFLEKAWEALEDSGNVSSNTKNSIGVYLGIDTTYGIDYGRSDKDATEMIGIMTSILSSRLNYHLDLKGPCISIDTACSSSLVAIHLACQALSFGDCSMAIAGGINLIGKMQSKIESMEAPKEVGGGKLRIFDKRSNGTIWGEGLGFVVLKPLSKAIKDRDNIQAIIKGSAINNSGVSTGISAPSAQSQVEVMLKAWEKANINPTNISHIEVNAIGTELGDSLEIKSLNKAFKKFTGERQFCSIGSPRPNIGHCLSVGAMASVQKTVMSLKHKQLTGLINIEKPNPLAQLQDSPVYINDKLKEWDVNEGVRIAGINSFGFSRTNGHLVLQEYTKEIINEEKNSKFIFTVSAKSKHALLKYIEKYEEYLEENSDVNIEDVCFTSTVGRAHFSQRLAILCDSPKDLRMKIGSIKRLEDLLSPEVLYGNHKIGSVSSAQNNTLSREKKKELDATAQKEINNIDSGKAVEKLLDICKLYVNGADIEWIKLYKDSNCSKISLPTYPFERRSYWAKDSHNKENEKVILIGKNLTNTQQIIGNIWGDILGYKKIDLDSDFFELGGNSLLVIRLISEIENSFDIDMESEMDDNIYEHNTIRKLANYIDNASSKQEHKRFIKNIEPYNDLFYKNCYYNSLFPVIKHFGGDVMRFMINDIMTYNLAQTENSINIDIKYNQIEEEETLYEDLAIECISMIYSEDIVGELINQINKERPAIIWIDCFYESIREQMYNKQHWAHTLLVFGYNLKNKTFDIIEHMHKDSLGYQKKSISFKELEACYEGYINNFHKNEQPSLYMFDKGATCKNIDKYNVYVGNFLKSKDIWAKGLNDLGNFAKDFKIIMQDEKKLSENVQELVASMNNIINAKEVVKYKAERLLQSEELTRLTNDVVLMWSKIRKNIAKFMYTNKYKINAVNESIELIDEIIKLEYRFIERFCTR